MHTPESPHPRDERAGTLTHQCPLVTERQRRGYWAPLPAWGPGRAPWQIRGADGSGRQWEHRAVGRSEGCQWPQPELQAA